MAIQRHPCGFILSTDSEHRARATDLNYTALFVLGNGHFVKTMRAHRFGELDHPAGARAGLWCTSAPKENQQLSVSCGRRPKHTCDHSSHRAPSIAGRDLGMGPGIGSVGDALDTGLFV